MSNQLIRRELGALTGVRFLAALLVFLFHMQIRLGSPYLKFRLDNIIGQGALGVNLFFVLSGFLLTYSQMSDFSLGQSVTAEYYKKFMIKRFARIYPAYFLGLLLTLVINCVLNVYPDGFFAALGLDLFMIQSFFPNLAMVWYGGGAWSVSVELLFYLILPFILPIILRVQDVTRLYIMLITLTILASVPGIINNIYPKIITFQMVYPFAFARLPEFLCGVVTALLVFRFNWKIAVSTCCVFVSILVVYLMFLANRFSGYTVHNIIALPAIISVICLCAQPKPTNLMTWLNSGIMKYLGKISYSFYIAQLPILALLDILLAKEH
jgi:peptidoglycan/LPS O-acetylase OafA/YrhL